MAAFEDMVSGKVSAEDYQHKRGQCEKHIQRLKPKSKSWGCQTAGKGRRTLHLQHHSLYQCQDVDTGLVVADPKHLHLQFYFYRDRLEMRGRISTATCRYHKEEAAEREQG